MSDRRKINKYLWLLSLYFLLFPLNVAAVTSLSINPAVGNYTVGEVFPVHIELASDEYVNAAQAVVKLPAAVVSFVSFSQDLSIFNLWPDEPVGQGNSISFSGGLPQPGFVGEGGRILTVYLRADSPGTARINYVSGSVHANDGRGSNILNTMTGGTYNILPVAVSPAAGLFLPDQPVISSPTHSEQTKWYQADSVVLLWAWPAGIEEISWLFDKTNISLPAEPTLPATTTVRFDGVDNGVWYFHLRFKNQTGWGPVAAFRVQVDKLPPEPFTITVDTDTAFSFAPKIFFPATDLHSGIDFYEIAIDDAQPQIIKAEEYKLSNMSQGYHQVVISAVDKAGNRRQAQAEVEVMPVSVKLKIAVSELGLNQLFLFYYLLIGLLILLLLLWLWHRRRDKQADKEMVEELAELNESVDFGFTTLRRDILSEIDIIREREKTQGLSPEEQERLKKLKIDLDVVEGYVRKELRDVTDLKARKGRKRYNNYRRRY